VEEPFNLLVTFETYPPHRVMANRCPLVVFDAGFAL
jgi:hypothetical protein